MKKLTILSLVFICMMSFHHIYAQEGYTYTLINNGNYSFTIGAVPNASASNLATSVQSYGFAILLPDGVTATFSSSLGGAADNTFFDGSALGQSAIDGYLITETLGSPASLLAPSAGTTTNIITVQVNGNPTTGEITILANDSALTTAVTSLKSFMQADMVDDGQAAFTNVVDPNDTGLSGTTSFSFETLSTPKEELTSVSVFPNPTKSLVNIKGINNLEFVEVFNVNGQRVLSNSSNLYTIDMSTLSSGLYLVKLYTDIGKSKTVKVVKQ